MRVSMLLPHWRQIGIHVVVTVVHGLDADFNIASVVCLLLFLAIHWCLNALRSCLIVLMHISSDVHLGGACSDDAESVIARRVRRDRRRCLLD